MTQRWRTGTGRLVDAGRPVAFSFEGRVYEALSGDTLASALLANGVHLVGRSFKYHRPRGIVGLGAEEPNAIVQVGQAERTVPNVRATQVNVYPGLHARRVNGWPSLGVDLGAALGLAEGMLPAGFYYKTFMWPASAWPLYERFIRRMAGLGRAPTSPDPDRYVKRNAHCDVLVIGAGPAGLTAACEAARSGARVMVVEDRAELGGSLVGAPGTIDRLDADAWVAGQGEALEEAPDVRVLRRTTAVGYYDHNFVVLCERLAEPGEVLPAGQPRERLWRVRARHVILATGAFERPLLFANNDRPGIMLASAALGYLRRYGALVGHRVIVATDNDSAYEGVREFVEAGAEVRVLDVRDSGASEPSVLDSLPPGVEVTAGARIRGARGRQRVAGVIAETSEGERLDLAADAVVVSGGWNPCVHLHAQSGGKTRFDPKWNTFVAAEPVQASTAVGACAATFDLAGCIGGAAAAIVGLAHEQGWSSTRPGDGAASEVSVTSTFVSAPPYPRDRGDARLGKSFLDFQNDTSVSDIGLAVQEGFASIEHVKRYTALGFGTDQGKLGNVSGAAVLASLLEAQGLGGELATTTFRPPYTPVTFGALAGVETGELFDPIRRTSIHSWHDEHGAVYEPVGQWERPYYYPRAGEDMSAAVRRECRAVRTGVGILDASTLGKIDVRGSDAAEFLNRIYTNGWLKLGVDRCRYGLMLGEDGMVMDDGVTTRLADDRFFMTTTTGGAAHVLSWLERWHQTEWPEMDVAFTSLTDQFATIALAGPLSRAVLEQLLETPERLAADAFPFMSSRVFAIHGVEVRVARISFSGELAYELYVPAEYGLSLWRLLVNAGEAHGITPYGTETMHVLRAEKGFIIVGQDTDGSVTPADLGLEGMCSARKDFIGRRSLSRADMRRPDRKQLVGLRTVDPDTVLLEGAQIVEAPYTRLPAKMQGHVTSSYWSEALGRSIALALLAGGHTRHGERVFVSNASGSLVEAAVTSSVFYDPTGSRQHV